MIESNAPVAVPSATEQFRLPFIRWANIAYYARGSVMPPRRIYDHEFVYVMGGDGHIVINGVAHPAPPDTLFLIQPRQWHSFRADQGVDWPLLGVHFDWQPRADTKDFTRFVAAVDPINENLFRDAENVPHWDAANCPMLDLRGRPRVRRMFEELVAEFGRDDAESQSGAGALLAATIFQIQREARFNQVLQSTAEIGADAVRRVQRARELLETPGNPTMTIDEVAQAVGWSSDHLRRMFRVVLQTSPGQVQMAARIRFAGELLRYGALPIREVALRCGFEDASHFARVFKRETGQSPREWVAFNARPRA